MFRTRPTAASSTIVGALGVDTTEEVGFDISANDNRAYAILTVGGIARLVTINLTTGAVTTIALVPGGPFRGLTVLSRGVPMVALRGNELIRFHSASPGTILGTATISGLQLGEQLVGIDVRPADGQLYGVGSTSRLYLLNAITGAATAIGVPFATPLVRHPLRRRLQPGARPPPRRQRRRSRTCASTL